ncbi:MAG: ArsR family transcriptional regulator [Methanoregula sp.]
MKIPGFTERENEFADLLVTLGMKKTVAVTFACLVDVPCARSCEIERGTGLRQPEVSVAIHHLIDQGWVTYTEECPKRPGPPIKVYRVAKPVSDILWDFGNKKMEEMKNVLEKVNKLKSYRQ